MVRVIHAAARAIHPPPRSLPHRETALAAGSQLQLAPPQVRLWGLWSAKWLTIARLAELKADVLGLDTDVLILADPLPALRVQPLASFHMLVPGEGARVNLGFLFVRGSAMVCVAYRKASCGAAPAHAAAPWTTALTEADRRSVLILWSTPARHLGAADSPTKPASCEA